MPALCLDDQPSYAASPLLQLPIPPCPVPMPSLRSTRCRGQGRRRTYEPHLDRPRTDGTQSRDIPPPQAAGPCSYGMSGWMIENWPRPACADNIRARVIEIHRGRKTLYARGRNVGLEMLSMHRKREAKPRKVIQPGGCPWRMQSGLTKCRRNQAPPPCGGTELAERNPCRCRYGKISTSGQLPSKPPGSPGQATSAVI